MEVTDVEGIYAKAADMMGELRVLKEEKTRTYTEEGQEHPELVYAFLSVVNLATQSSVLLLCGGREVALAKEVNTTACKRIFSLGYSTFSHRWRRVAGLWRRAVRGAGDGHRALRAACRLALPQGRGDHDGPGAEGQPQEAVRPDIK